MHDAGGLRRRQRAGPADAGDAAGPDHAAGARARGGIAPRPKRRRRETSRRRARRRGKATNRSATNWRNPTACCVRRPASIRRCARPRPMRQHAGDSAPGQPRRRSQCPAQIAGGIIASRARAAGLLDTPSTGFLYAARSRPQHEKLRCRRPGGVAQLVRARKS